jgi:hypothetical protein
MIILAIISYLGCRPRWLRAIDYQSKPDPSIPAIAEKLLENLSGLPVPSVHVFVD